MLSRWPPTCPPESTDGWGWVSGRRRCSYVIGIHKGPYVGADGWQTSEGLMLTKDMVRSLYK